jgi:hypothetical protein
VRQQCLFLFVQFSYSLPLFLLEINKNRPQLPVILFFIGS